VGYKASGSEERKANKEREDEGERVHRRSDLSCREEKRGQTYARQGNTNVGVRGLREKKYNCLKKKSAQHKCNLWDKKGSGG